MSPPAEQPEADQPGDGGSAGGWRGEVARAALVLVVAFVGFVAVPDRLVAYLSLHVAPRTRDALALIWFAAFFVFMSWLVVRLQGQEER